jgi:hypothetical protein
MNFLRSILQLPFFGLRRRASRRPHESLAVNLYADWGFFTGQMRLGFGVEMNSASDKDGKSPLSVAGWIALVILLRFLLASLWYAAQVWSAMAGVPMSGWGWFFLIAGIVVTVGLGAGLMALVFYSSRHNMDQ